MKIGNVGGGKPVSGPKRAKGSAKAGGNAFADELNAVSGASAAESLTEGGVVETSSLEGVDAILAMQEAGDRGDRRARRQACAYGEELLNRLTAIQDSLLFGAISKDRLAELAHRIRAGRSKVKDERLNQILDEIELRAEVEIAKFTRGI